MTTIAVIDASTDLAGVNLAPVVAALQVQMDRDVGPLWGITTGLTLVAPGAQPPAGAWQLVLLDDSDQAGDLGYHELTADGLPLGRVFVRTDHVDGLNWTVTASHEMIEMRINAHLDKVKAFGVGGTVTAIEACDAVEDEQYAYDINGVQVSNFVTPAYFSGGGKPWDFRRLLTGPCPTMLPGGYLSVCGPDGQWTERFAEESNGVDRARLYRPWARRYRRKLPREEWRRSLR